MIVQRVQVGIQVEQIFVDKARLVVRETHGIRPTIILELDVSPNDPRYTKGSSVRPRDLGLPHPAATRRYTI